MFGSAGSLLLSELSECSFVANFKNSSEMGNPEAR